LSIRDGVIGIFHRLVTLGPTWPITEMCIKLSARSKGIRCVGLTTFSPSGAVCLEVSQPYTPGTLWVCPGVYIGCFSFALLSKFLDWIGLYGGSPHSDLEF
jgi:hypothetical protein